MALRMALEGERFASGLAWHWTPWGKPLTLCLKSTVPMIVADFLHHGVDCPGCLDAALHIGSEKENPSHAITIAQAIAAAPPIQPSLF